jgi:hypothetical protein
MRRRGFGDREEMVGVEALEGRELARVTHPLDAILPDGFQ